MRRSFERFDPRLHRPPYNQESCWCKRPNTPRCHYHHLLACTPREQRAALNVLKFLSNELRVSIVALGTSEALHVMRTDPQIASRFQSCALPSWTANDDLRRFLAGFLQQLDVDGNDIVNNRVAIDYILDLTSG